MEIKCKNCVYYQATVGLEQELTGHFESVIKPYGICNHMDDEVREDEWCGQYKEGDMASGDRGQVSVTNSHG